MRRCLTCDRRFDDGRLVCPTDGDVLADEGRPAAETGRVLAGRYRLGNLLGAGGMGRVFEAVRLDNGESVAVKILKESAAGSAETQGLAEKRFQVEAEAAAALDHPGVVKIFEWNHPPEGASFIAMERLWGATFDELRRAGKFASPERALELLREVCEVLGAAHRRGIVHRDLKPSNLFLHREGPGSSRVKVLDFGIAKILDRTGESLTSTGEFLGTLLYMAPEQIAGEPVTTAMDVYSLGVIFFEALTGKVPFAAKSPLDLVRLHASQPAPSLSAIRPEVPPELDLVVERCLMKKPENRFPHAGELARVLGELAAAPWLPPVEQTRVIRSNPASWVGVILEERYEIQEWITAGRFGSEVYRAIHLRTGASVAVRLWKTGGGPARDLLLEVFRNEARAMGVRHPNLITILDLGFNDDCVYLVSELVESISLRTLLVRRGNLPPPLCRELVKGAADGLRALHEKGIVSGGMSPETLRVVSGKEGPEKILLSPFGLFSLKQLALFPASGSGGAEDRSVEYISPEQNAGTPPDARSDLYSLALIFLEMLAGPRTTTLPPREPPPKGAPPTDLPLGALDTLLGPAWKEFFARALHRDPTCRFAGATEFLAALEALAVPVG